MKDDFVEKPIYDGLSVEILEIAPQGVLCGSASADSGLTGGLDAYKGSAL